MLESLISTPWVFEKRTHPPSYSAADVQFRASAKLFRTVTNATLLAGFASFCIMLCELDGLIELQAELDYFEAAMMEQQEDELYSLQYGDLVADQPDEDRFADYNFEPEPDDEDWCDECFRRVCRCQDMLEDLWHRRDAAPDHLFSLGV